MPVDFHSSLELKVAQQLRSQRVGYLLGAGSSCLGTDGYPLASELWSQIRSRISDAPMRSEIQAKLDGGATGIEQALDLLDDGGARDTPYRHLVTAAISELFLTKIPSLDLHIEFVRRLSQRGRPSVRVFSLNYDPMIERAAEAAKVRLADGFHGVEDAFFDAAVFEESIVRIRGTHRGRQMEATVKPIHLLKLHGSVGWYEGSGNEVRRSAFSRPVPGGTKRLMVPPQRRKATETMNPPYAALWSIFRGCLGHNTNPVNRLVCFGYGFGDEHVNAVIEAAMPRTDFTLLIFAKALSDCAWNRWSVKDNAIVVTEARCSLYGKAGPGHTHLWRFEQICKEV